jgi:hypothetical protein
MGKKITIGVVVLIILITGVAFVVIFMGNKKITNGNNQDKVVLKNEIDKIKTLQCGEVVASHFAPQDKTPGENETLKCLGNAILDCQSVVVNFTGKGSYRYSVDKKENNFCFISQEVDNPYKKTTCKFPLAVLENNKPSIKGIESQYFAITAYSLASHKVKDAKTGETIDMECY